MSITRVVVADDHAEVRMGLRALLVRIPGVQVVGEAENGREAIDLVHQLKPDVLLLDMEMPILDGIVQHEGSPVKILALSIYDDIEYIEGVLQTGAAGYLTKDEVVDMLGRAIHSISRGERCILSRRASVQLAV